MPPLAAGGAKLLTTLPQTGFEGPLRGGGKRGKGRRGRKERKGAEGTGENIGVARILSVSALFPYKS